MDHPLAVLLADVAMGRNPPADGLVTIMRPPDDRLSAVLAFTDHHVVAADVGPIWLGERLRPGDLAAPLSPWFLAELGEATGREVSTIDAVMVATALPGEPTIDLTAVPPILARPYRTDVHAWCCDGGMVELGRGLAGRWEVAVKVDELARGRGIGRTLFTAARQLVTLVGDWDEPVWAQVQPGNVASVRALLEAGYRPGGAEALLARA